MIDYSEAENAGQTGSRSVLWRSPAGLQRRVRENAKELDLSQNAFITSSMLFSELVLIHRGAAGLPLNVLRVVLEMNAAVKTNDTVLAACHTDDWNDVQRFIAVLRDAELVAGLRTRQDDLAPHTVLFSFRFTPDGEGAWKIIGPRLADLIACIQRDSRAEGVSSLG